MFKPTALAGIAFSAFMIPTMANAAAFSSSSSQPAALARDAAYANSGATSNGLGSVTSLIYYPVGITAADGNAIPGSNLQRIILDSPNHQDNRLARRQARQARRAARRQRKHDKTLGGGNLGGSPTPEPSSLLLFGLGLSGLMLFERFRKTAANSHSEVSRNNSNS